MLAYVCTDRQLKIWKLLKRKGEGMAGTTGLEPATSDVTGRRSNQLNYVPALRQYFYISIAAGLFTTLV